MSIGWYILLGQLQLLFYSFSLQWDLLLSQYTVIWNSGMILDGDKW